MPTDQSTEYINSTKYDKWKLKLKDVFSSMSEQRDKNYTNRKLRYAEIDIETKKEQGELAPDELFIPQHIIDSNIRREQSSYVQYVTQSHRAVILTNVMDANIIPDILEKDVTQKIRYDGWQIPMYSVIDAMQQNGFAVMEVVFDTTKTGEVAHEYISYGDFGFAADTQNLQDAEVLTRAFYYSKTKLLEMCENAYGFKREEVDKIVSAENTTEGEDEHYLDRKDKSLYRVFKVMFRVKGIVYAAWAVSDKAENWIRDPRPLYLGRKEINPLTKVESEVPETEYPYYLFPYLISENPTISLLKGRAFLDQDCQEAVTSLMSSYVTAQRRAAGLYFAKDTDDINTADELQAKNIYFKQGVLINAKIRQFQLQAPGADALNAIEGLRSSNLQETSQINFAAMNRQDARKTATEVSAATQSSQALTTVQVVLFSSALRAMYRRMFEIIQYRVNIGLIKVKTELNELYQMRWLVKPSGDTDVIERQQTVQQMMSAWPVMQNTPASQAFLSDLLMLMFPHSAQRYIKIFEQQMQQQQAQQQSAQAQQAQQAQQLAMQVVELSKHPEYFSDAGKSQVLPMIKSVSDQIMKQVQAQPQQPKA